MGKSGGVWVNLLKKENLWQKLKKKMISADVKANVKWQETKELVALSYKLLQELL